MERVLQSYWFKLTFSQIFQLFLATLTFIIVAKSLGADQFGPLTAILALNQIAAPLADMGFAALLQQSFARNPDEFAVHWGHTLVASAVCASVLTVVVCVLGRFTIRPLEIWPLLGLAVIADIVFKRFIFLASVACQVRREFGAMVAVGITSPCITFLAAILWDFGFHMSTLSSWLLWYLTASVLSAVTSAAIIMRCIPIPRFARGFTLNMLGEAILFLLVPLSQNINDNADKVILSAMQPAAVVGSYGLAYRIVLVVLLPIQALQTLFVGEYFQAGAQGVISANKVARERLLPNLILACIASLGLFICAPLVPRVFGTQFPELVLTIRFLSLLPMLKACQLTFGNVLSASRYQRTRVIVQLVVAASSIGLTVVLVPFWGWRGAVIGSLLADALLVALLLRAIRHATADERKKSSFLAN